MDGADRHTKEKNTVSCVFDKMVMPMRLELTRVAPLPPQSSVSAIPPRLRFLNAYLSYYIFHE